MSNEQNKEGYLENEDTSKEGLENKENLENDDDQIDDLGYEIPKEKSSNVQDKDEKKETSKQDDSEGEIDPVSGYGDDKGEESKEASKADSKEGEDSGDGEFDLGDTKGFLQEEIDLI